MQAMLDAIAVGHAAVWDRYLDPRVVYVSESGAIESRDSLLAQLKPLPDGITGSISIPSFKVNVFGDTAVTVYVASETESYFGHPLTAEYLTSDTWRRGPQGWRLIASHVYVKPFDPPAITLPPEQLDDYVGTYRLTPEISYTIRRDGAQLTGERTGKPPQPLSVEARDVLFVAGQPRSRKIFLRDPAGHITGFADRREGHDIVWQRST
jgi:hypothetical protein